MRMICSNCGTEAPDKAKYCPKCGADLSANGLTGIIEPGRTLKAAFGGKIKLPALIAFVAAAVVVVAIVVVQANTKGAGDQENAGYIT